MNDAPYAIDPTAPDWFRRAIAHPVQSRYIDVAECRIHYLAWFEAAASPAAPGLLLIHGGGAHANWWRFIAPFFAASHRVCAIDLSGMGDSGARDLYTPETWTSEIDAVLRDAGLYADGSGAAGAKPLVVGHSFGGFMAMKFGAESGHRLGGTVIVDSPVQDPADTPLPEPATSTRVAPPIYPDEATARGRFRLMPAQPCENNYITDFIARTSIREAEGGWTWKFDFRVMGSRRFGEPYRAELEALQGRAALIHGEKSAIVSPQTVAYMSQLMGPEAPVVEIPDAHHHLMLDQPLAFVAALRAILDAWARSPE